MTSTASNVIATGYVPHRFQATIHRNLRRFSVLVCHRRFGKTVLAVNELVDKALRFQRSDGRYAYIAPFLKQAKKIAWPYLKKYTLNIPGCHYNEADLTVRLPNGSIVQVLGADNPDAIRGDYLDGAVLDEVADFKPFVWGEVIRPMLADRKGWVLFIGTPKGVNLFYELYQTALREADWYAGMFTILDTGTFLIDEEEQEAMRATMTEAQWRQEMLCDFQASSENILLTIDAVQEACGRHYEDSDYTWAPKIVGVDVARFGDDRSVIMKRQGLVAQEPLVYKDIDNMQLASHVINVMTSWEADACFIDGGRGEGVIDRCRQLGHNVMEVQFGSAALNPRYANKRSEMWDNMAKWVKEGGAIPDNLELKNDLVVPTYHFTPANKFQLEPKDKMKERTGMSPDIGDSLALTFAEQVAPKGLAREPRFVSKHEYDPWGDD